MIIIVMKLLRVNNQRQYSSNDKSRLTYTLWLNPDQREEEDIKHMLTLAI